MAWLNILTVISEETSPISLILGEKDMINVNDASGACARLLKVLNSKYWYIECIEVPDNGL